MASPRSTSGSPAWEELQGSTTSEIEDMRLLAQTSTFFLGKGILGYDQIDEYAHAELCNFMDYCDEQYRMVLMPRGHLKSTICTITDSVRLAVKNPEHERILIVNEVYENACAFLLELKHHWENRPMLRRLFPELVPEKFIGPGSWWSTDEACLRRSSPYKEATWTAMGALGSAQSKHFSTIKGDDLIGEKAKKSRSVMLGVINWNASVKGLLDNLRTSRIDWIGTRKTIGDMYEDVMNKYKRLAIFIREPIENGEPIFPLKYSLEALLEIAEQEPEVWYHDFLNNPIGKGGRDWSTGALRFFELTERGNVIYQHHLTEQWKTWDLRELDIVITVDPNSGKQFAPDKAAIVVHGVSPDRQIFVLDSWSDRPSPSGLVERVWETCCRWRPRTVGIEDAGQQNTAHYFEQKCIEEGRSFHVTPLSHKNKEKDVRIRGALDGPIKARRLYLQNKQLVLKSQIELFPQLAEHNWDELDSLSYGPEVYSIGETLKDRARAKDAAKRLLAARGATGYGDTIRRSTDPASSVSLVSPSKSRISVMRRLR